MRPLDVVAVPEAVESPPLSSPVGLWRCSRLRLQGSVKPLKASVLLGVSGLDPLRHYPQLDPPCGQRREASQSDAGERRAVVGPDDPGKTVLPKARSSERLTSGPVGAIQTVAYQQVPGHRVLGRQGSMRIPSPVRNQPLRSMDHTSLGCWAWAKGSLQLVALRRRLRRLTRPARSSMPLAVLGMARARRARPNAAGDDLLRAPCGALALRLNDATGHLCGCGVGVVMRGSVQVEQTSLAVGLIPTNQLVTSLATDTKPPAQLGNSLFPRSVRSINCNRSDSTLVSFQGNTSSSSGIATTIPRCVTHVPSLGVTYLPGLYPPSLLSRRGRGDYPLRRH